MATEPRFQELLRELSETYTKKNSDYSGDGDPFRNFRRAEELGVSAFLGCLIRKGDKWSRIQTLVLKGEENRAVVEESLRDTLIDDAVYALIAVILLEEEAHDQS